MNSPLHRNLNETVPELRKAPLNNPEFTVSNPQHGPIINGAPIVFVSDEAYERITIHANSDKHNEVGGALLGRFCKDEQDNLFVMILEIVENEKGQPSRAHLVMPPEFWLQVDDILEDDFPHLWRLGTYHTHPGIGVFVSGTDLRSIRSIFNSVRHIAVVIDPHREEMGFFVWKDGEVKRGGCYVFSHSDLDALIHAPPCPEC